MSVKRKEYTLRLIARIIVFILCICAAILRPDMFDILKGMNFFAQLSPLHLLWLVWMIDLVYQIFPLKSGFALGSRKVFAHSFRPGNNPFDIQLLRSYTKASNKAAIKVFFLWSVFIAFIGILYCRSILNKIDLFLICVAFYVCDLICVLIWCPFRLILKTKCCTTCRIFNWDHMMMFSPLLFLDGFYGASLVIASFLAFGVWEVGIMIHPEHFWEKTNIALKCSECTDKLCTQYCGRK